MSKPFKNIYFELQIDPIAQPRPKAARIGNSIRIYTPQGKRVKDYKAAIKKAFEDSAGPDFQYSSTADVAVVLNFYFKRSQDMLRATRPDGITPHLKKPDIDNLVKAVMDALNGVAWHDDSQVYTISSSKCYHPVILGGKSGRKRTTVSSKICCTISYHEP